MNEQLSPESPEQQNEGMLTRIRRAFGSRALEQTVVTDPQPEVTRGNRIQIVDAQGGGETRYVHVKHPDRDGVE